MESQLKSSCEQLIASQTQYLLGPLLAYFTRTSSLQQSGEAQHGEGEFKKNLVEIVQGMTGVAPEQMAAGAQGGGALGSNLAATPGSQSPFGQQLRTLLRQTRLYLANPSTERVLCKPIHRTVSEVLEQLKFFVATHFPKCEGSSTLGSSAAAAGAPALSQEDALTVYLEESIALLENILRENFVE
jgi:hypothetical protein